MFDRLALALFKMSATGRWTREILKRLATQTEVDPGLSSYSDEVLITLGTVNELIDCLT